MDYEQQPPCRFRPTIAPPTDRKDGQWVQFESPEQAAAKEAALRAFMQPGQRVPLLWDDGVTLLEVAEVQPDGTIEMRSAQD